jgi:hypothetical protein
VALGHIAKVISVDGNAFQPLNEVNAEIVGD